MTSTAHGTGIGASRRRFLAASTGLAAAGMLAPWSAFGAQKLGRVAYGQGSIDPFFAAGYVALKLGYFGEHGLEVEYLNSQSGPRTNQLLAAGQIVFGATAATAAPALTAPRKPTMLSRSADTKHCATGWLRQRSEPTRLAAAGLISRTRPEEVSLTKSGSPLFSKIMR